VKRGSPEEDLQRAKNRADSRREVGKSRTDAEVFENKQPDPRIRTY
jgi:hypothetical protein